MKAPYQRYVVEASPLLGRGEVYRPEVEIDVTGGNGHASFLALVDTGADATLLPRAIGEAIGAEIDDGRRSYAAGIGSRRLGVAPGRVELEMRQGREHYRWLATVGFADFSNAEDQVAILGHAGCLEFLIATFDGEARELTLKPSGHAPWMIR